MRRTAAVSACSLLVLLAGCGSQGSSQSGAAASGNATKASTTTPASATPTTVAKGLPTVTGGYGDKPTIKYPAGKAPQKLEKRVLSAGTGPVVAKGDLLLANYLGQVWGGKVFDNSYDRHAPAGFPIGVGKVIPGWDDTLVGQHVGSRVLLVIPSDKGYGAQGQPQAGIPGGATLTFVVDIVASYAKNASGDPHATAQTVPAGLPKVTGALGGPATITVPKGLAAPKSPRTVVLAKGHGKPLAKGTGILQFAATYWDGKNAGSTWQQTGPEAVPLGSGTPFDTLVGTPIGSRVLLEVPAAPASSASSTSAATPAQPAVAVVVDVVAEPAATA